MSIAISRQTTSVFSMSCLKYELNSVVFARFCAVVIGETVVSEELSDGRLYDIPVPLTDGVEFTTTPFARRSAARSFCFRVLPGISISLAYVSRNLRRTKLPAMSDIQTQVFLSNLFHSSFSTYSTHRIQI